ncbi:MAG: HAMP domain-containing protein [Desulfarculus sp.]|nr:MAG: HAMP domain-containing protein [Desulfarculus sp.]
MGLKGRGFASLRLRLIFYLLLPVSLLLVGLGVAGFFYARGYLMEGLRQTSLLGLQRAAHSIDMRLAQPGEAVDLLNSLEGLSQATIGDWEKHLAGLPGVARVKLDWLGEAQESQRPMMGGRGGWLDRGMHRVALSRVTNPRFDTSSGQQTVSLVFDLQDQEKKPAGRLEVAVRFAYLLEGLKVFEQWKGERSFLVDSTGRVLAQGGGSRHLERLGAEGDPFEVQVLEALLTKPAGTLVGPGRPAEEVAGFYRLQKAPWTLVLFARGDKVLGPIRSFMRHYIVAGAAAVALVVLIILVVTGKVAGAVRTVCQAARRVARGDYVEVPTPKSRDEFRRLADSFNTMVEGLKQKDYLRDTFSRYVDPQVARRLMSRPEATALGGDKRLVAIMMTDVRGFTPLAERLSPEQTITIINRYLSVLIEVISAGQGIIVDFLGDSLLAFFDSLENGPRRAAEQAVCCALELRRATEDFNQQMRSEGLPDLATGIGLHAGEVVVGNIGSFTRTKYGIVGGPVNLTNRIQAQAEGGEIIASQAVVELIGPELKVTRGFEALLKGVEGQVQLYALLDLPSCQPQGQE